VIVDADLKGGDLVAIGAISNAVAFYDMANPAISSVADLRGKKVGITRFGASTDFAMRILLEKHKWQRGHRARACRYCDFAAVLKPASLPRKGVLARLRQGRPLHAHRQGGL
jgi:ABC-type nitrate/sulfonate/bicarbonate transport system substrate-binding protein